MALYLEEQVETNAVRRRLCLILELGHPDTWHQPQRTRWGSEAQLCLTASSPNILGPVQPVKLSWRISSFELWSHTNVYRAALWTEMKHRGVWIWEGFYKKRRFVEVQLPQSGPETHFLKIGAWMPHMGGIDTPAGGGGVMNMGLILPQTDRIVTSSPLVVIWAAPAAPSSPSSPLSTLSLPRLLCFSRSTDQHRGVRTRKRLSRIEWHWRSEHFHI